MVFLLSLCFSQLGTKDSGSIIKEIKARTVKVKPLILQYNKSLAQFTGDNKPPPLPTDRKLDELLLIDSELWELDRSSCTDRWARDRPMQQAFKHLYNVARANEEVIILLSHSQRHINWHIADIKNVTNALKALSDTDCELGPRLLIRGEIAAGTLRSWKGLQNMIKILRKHSVCEEELLVGVEGSISGIWLN
jgi:hypothetical protein